MALWFIAGTAGELIKVYPLLHESSERQIPFYMLSTGQSGVNFWRQWEDFDLPQEPAIRLLPSAEDLQQSRAALSWFIDAFRLSSSKLIQRIEKGGAARPMKGDAVVVHGDTLSTLIGAIYARRLGLPLVHVEAGLRSSRVFEPFPEEICRRLVSRLTDYHMVPDEQASLFLKSHFSDDHVVFTQGNTLLDAIHLVLKDEKALQALPDPYVVVNIHRFENLKSPSRWNQIVNVILQTAKSHSVLMVLHAQTEHKLEQEPETRKRLEEAGVVIKKRIPFSEFVHWLEGADYVISDGGSNQEECYYLGKPCLLMRSATERSEGLNENCLLSKFNEPAIQDFLKNIDRFRRPVYTSEKSPTEIIFESLSAFLPTSGHHL